MDTAKQGDRLLVLDTPLGPDVLLLTGFSGSEAMSRLFSYHLDLLSANQKIQAADIIGQNVTWEVDYKGGDPRYFNGYVSRFTGSTALVGGKRVYHAEVVPWLWFLTRTADCKIFPNKSVPDILQQVFADYPIAKVQLSLSGKYSKREYCVQYRETDFNFISRLMEQEGIFYFFSHDNKKHTLVLGDATKAYVDCVEKEVSFSPPPGGPKLITAWDHQYSFRAGMWTQTDYNFETPKTSLLSTTKTIVKLPDMDEFELFDYPGEYLVKADGTAEIKVRMEEEEAPCDVVTGAGGCTTFTPGGKFTLKEHEVESEQGSYVLTAVHHHAREYGYSDSTAGGEHSSTFTCIPATVTFRPPRLTPKSIVPGAQTAVVVGPKGEEIYTDKYGRVKVQFFWDRYGKKDENSSCWIRVAQVWAGKRWGASFWPRIGQEVVVDFLEGDPDRPLITGSVYNADQMPPYQGKGPDSKHESDNKVNGIKTNSTKGGDGYNELRFDDTKGSEQIFIHAQHDMDVRVLNDSRARIFGNKHVIVGGQDKDGNNFGSDYQKVFVDRHIHVLNNHLEHIEGNLQLLVGKGNAQDGGNVDISIEKDTKELIGGACHLHVKGARNEKVDGQQSLTVGGDQQEKVTGNHALESGQAMYFKAGMTLVLEAGMQLSLKVGGNFIDIGPAGVSIVGTMVMINSGGSPGSGSAPSPTAPQDAQDAKPTDPNLADDSKTGYKSASS